MKGAEEDLIVQQGVDGLELGREQLQARRQQHLPQIHLAVAQSKHGSGPRGCWWLFQF